MLNILNLIDDARCFETVRAMRWPQGVTCPHCDSSQVTKQGHDESQPERQKYECTVCRKRFDDLTEIEDSLRQARRLLYGALTRG